MADVSIEQLADDMFELVSSAAGQKKLKAGDLTKAMKEKYGDLSRADTKAAIKQLIDSGRCVYGYFGGSSIELPRVEGSANE
jgi:predicted polyphosphate/ATP-dependent NAD kinase